jgi:hypothetical protein
MAPADTYVCYAAVGRSECLVAGHPPIALPEAHALLLTTDGIAAAHALSVNPVESGSVAVVAAIRFI